MNWKYESMLNLSLNKEPLVLKKQNHYFIVDALYLNEIKNKLAEIDVANLSNEIREKVFPYTDTPFAEYKANENIFNIEKIRKVDYREVVIRDKSFSTDTGLIAFIERKLLIDFIVLYKYDELVDSINEVINTHYFKKITANFLLTDIGFILSPGINSGVDFDGSGTYQII